MEDLTVAAHKPDAVAAALADIEAGMRRADAARLHGVNLSTLTRARKRLGLPDLPAGRPVITPTRSEA